jgi:Tfp pilus assembly PilM family ATPase
VMAYGVRRIAQEVRNSLEFAASQTAQAGVGHVVLSGSAVDIPGFAEALSSALGMSVEPRVVREAHAGAFGDVAPTRLSVAAGLTTEEAPA